MFQRPSAADWRLTSLVFIAFAILAVSFGFASGLFQYELAEPTSILRTAIIALILPAFLEELVFRGPVLWLAKRQNRYLPLVAGLSFLLFILWHPLNGWLFLTEARDYFFDCRFLIIAAGLGAITTWLACRMRSLWPPIVFHWLAVVGWKACLGAPAFL
ncbi:CPBP family glutamic-type intramembrane protease [Hyphomonas sp. FCG-A18]|uniref:CPBP family glutamic-type intramembrane protease n=1 Tax=Hyphomonas sp. FCG-A18 TaxID=3080019 RepID=UPI002B2FF4AC|nr:CPBP family glutamic-type intramembrane protease [Hyphomonas sp. FCG-A18]